MSDPPDTNRLNMLDLPVPEDKFNRFIQVTMDNRGQGGDTGVYPRYKNCYNSQLFQVNYKALTYWVTTETQTVSTKSMVCLENDPIIMNPHRNLNFTYVVGKKAPNNYTEITQFDKLPYVNPLYLNPIYPLKFLVSILVKIVRITNTILGWRSS